MSLQKFEVGRVYSTTALYGGTLSIVVLSRTDSTITYRYTEECSDDRSVKVAKIIRQLDYNPSTLEPSNEVESIVAWEYRSNSSPQSEPDRGYYYANPARSCMTIAGYDFECVHPNVYTWIGEETTIDVINMPDNTYLVRIETWCRGEGGATYLTINSFEELEKLVEESAF